MIFFFNAIFSIFYLDPPAERSENRRGSSRPTISVHKLFGSCQDFSLLIIKLPLKRTTQVDFLFRSISEQGTFLYSLLIALIKSN